MLETQSLPHLPERKTTGGAIRRVGNELEFSGLEEREAANLVAKSTGGEVIQRDTVWSINTPDFGACDVYLDTKYRDEIEQLAGDAGLKIAGAVIPVELVTEPFDPAALPSFDRLLATLRNAGAEGSRRRLAYGFGVHFNIEVAELDHAPILRVARAYALLERFLRAEIELDLSRRVLPHLQMYPKELTDVLTCNVASSLEDVAELYLQRTTSRNHGLDLLPLLAHAAPETVHRYVGDGTKIAPRPAFHYRLPESRIDEPDWGIAADWRRWVLVEHVAQDADLLATLSRSWAAWRAENASDEAWVATVRDILAARSEQVAA